MTTDTSLPVSSQSGSRPAHGAPSISGSGGRRAPRHPLLGAFPLAVMTLATFLVVFALLMARLQSGADPGLRASANGVLQARGEAGTAIRTRTSGGAVPAASGNPVATEVSSPLVTRTSGRAGREESDDA